MDIFTNHLNLRSTFPHRKLCTAADTRTGHHQQASGLSSASTSSVSNNNMQSSISTIISRPTTCTAGPMATASTTISGRGSLGSARVPAAAGKIGSSKLISAKSSMVHNSVGKGQLSSGKKSSSAKQQSGANRTANKSATGGSHTPMQKTPRSRKKSSGGGKNQHSANMPITTTSIMPNIVASPVVTISSGTVSNASYSLVTNSGLQAADLISSGLVGIDASGNFTSDPNLVKFVVTSVGSTSNVNGAADNMSTSHVSSTGGTITVPIFSNAMGTTPVLLSNLGTVSLHQQQQQHDGKMNIKSRPLQSAGTISKADKARARKHSGGGKVAQTVTNAQQPIMMDTYINTTQDNKGNSGGVSAGVILSAQQITSPAASPLLRPVSIK